MFHFLIKQVNYRAYVYIHYIHSGLFCTLAGEIITDRMTPSSSSSALGEGMKTGSDGQRSGWHHTCKSIYLANTLHFDHSNCEYLGINHDPINCSHLELFAFQIHLNQGVTHQVSEATTIVVSIRFGVISGIVNMWKLQATVVFQVFVMEILKRAKYLRERHVLKEMKALQHINALFVSCINYV